MQQKNANPFAVGDELPLLRKTLSQRQIDCYSGVRPRSLHSDADWARQKGFKAPLAQALMSTAYVSEMMVASFGVGFIKGGKMSVSFTKPVYAGDTLTLRGRVKDRTSEGDRVRVVIDIRCENSDGELTMVGTASGLESGAASAANMP